MKIALKAAEYTFAPGSNSITFNVTGFDVRGLFYVANIASRTDIYVVADASLGNVAVNGTTVTFPGPMTTMSASDPLLILYDDRVGAQPVSVTALPLPNGAAQDGSDPASPAVANAGSGIRGWLATIAGLLKLGTMAKASSASVTIATDQGNLEPGGTAITAATMPAGGIGLTGWLSAIWSSLSTSLGSATGGTAATVSRLVGGVYNATAPTLTNGQQAALQVDANGQLKVVAAGGGTASGSITAAGTNGTAAQAVQGIVGGVPAPTLAVATPSANAVLEGRVASAASTNATSLKTSAGNLVEIEVYNLATSVRFLKVYNKASAPTVGTDTPTWTIPIPAGGGFAWAPPIPRTFATGLAYAITGAVSDTDTTAIAANDVVGIIRYL